MLVPRVGYKVVEEKSLSADSAKRTIREEEQMLAHLREDAKIYCQIPSLQIHIRAVVLWLWRCSKHLLCLSGKLMLVCFLIVSEGFLFYYNHVPGRLRDMLSREITSVPFDCIYFVIMAVAKELDPTVCSFVDVFDVNGDISTEAESHLLELIEFKGSHDRTVD